ncbi:hypothetical protein D210916BOD24_08410 [Alteromonas sp. D210916BOD_24]|uniref:hypothetical protein n=1 Tax=Alteromonas sp. D210916BOD_24 TaxID=3157618 RepID=UPI00399D0BF4
MCKPDVQLLLCTCNGQIDKSKGYWQLHEFRKGTSPLDFSVGEVIAPYTVDTKFGDILSQLNRPGGCFDFAYVPASGDVLNLIYPNITYTFIYDGVKKRWIDDDTAYHLDSLKMVKEGLIAPDKVDLKSD